MKECEEEEKAQYDFKNYVASATFTASLLDKVRFWFESASAVLWH